MSKKLKGGGEELGWAGDTPGIMQMKQNRFDMIIDGSYAGVISCGYSVQDIKRLKAKRDESASKYEQKKNEFNLTHVSMYGSGYRNAEYVQSGRKFMRIAGCSAGVRAAWEKCIALTTRDVAEERYKG